MYGPIDTRDPASCAAAYTGILRWPVAVGYRYRPRGGCTCGTPESCPAPGAHPLPGPVTVCTAEQLGDELAASPGAALIAPTVSFDAIALPREYGMAAMISLDRVAPVPCLMEGDRAMLLVLPSTGRYAVGGMTDSAVQVRSGPTGWVALPPSHGVRWDTPPWHEQAHQPLPLLHGQDLRSHLDEALRVVAPQAADSMAVQRS
ncbi:hypothetical protein [Streptomyces sp. JB150]|uniref:hypothetical protein n=1 Tax=Streptomyces sp. JB150 TaxID=2714844 RepID=UPI0014086510|nr:hypothetical protein [Streptomyces sp. JB150]QIJ62534.1 hypothetical protein G7Z13_11160 [Streptomyces sp. JB150]